MDREPEHHTETFLDDCLIQYRRADSRFLEACATAAHAMGALEWLADRYRHARAAALQDLRSTVVVCLDVCLAQLYSRFMNEPHKAKAKWRQILRLIFSRGANRARVPTSLLSPITRRILVELREETRQMEQR